MADTQAITRQDRDDIKAASSVSEAEQLPAEREIRRTRAQISQTTALLQQQLRANMSWQLWLYRYPYQAVALAAAAGIVAGFALPGGRPSRSNRPAKPGATPTRREAELIKQTGQNTLVATVLTNVATTVLREGAQYLAKRFFDDPRQPDAQ
ncbi:hypothetical protein [Gloeobacter kilaueensis]|uniref:DUF3618 domain-containing protein n=1 Tax=Gloeobacter kilaueensis (strain ATCC BAA-2537 / CCAP 1431/1 / ULC 316 / JS1) TaxID=1183438 RepID=U5QL79_GLOK1|nr:hypothetical protein [Gloeobacter kilaueensis]AGY58334.1 hypothetical protein GKIL_2088 [Gloeobacter kilaueensis JS1]